MKTTTTITPRTLSFEARDGVALQGELWPAQGRPRGRVIINAATGVQARYYHRYAQFLAENGLEALTWDYRGIGQSRPDSLRQCAYRWRDWGMLDFAAALQMMTKLSNSGPLMVVGHSIGGFLPGLAPGSERIDRMLTMGAQYAWRGDYAKDQRQKMIWKWHRAMPFLTMLNGYFPGKRLGWLEDLPKGVAYEWAFRKARFEDNHPADERLELVTRMAAIRAPILAVGMADDPFGTPAALRRTLGYHTGAQRQLVMLNPQDYGRDAIGHFNLFHDSHREGFWQDSLRWLLDGENPWPLRAIPVSE